MDWLCARFIMQLLIKRLLGYDQTIVSRLLRMFSHRQMDLCSSMAFKKFIEPAFSSPAKENYGLIQKGFR
jgi:hypothetical protein